MLAGAVCIGGLPGTSSAAGPEVGVFEAAVSDEWEIAVFLCAPSVELCEKETATGPQKQAIQALLEGLPEVTEVRFVDRASAYKSFRADFAANKPMLKEVRAKEIPESFRVRVRQGAERERVREAVLNRPGVRQVIDEAEYYGDESAIAREPDVNVFFCSEGSELPACKSGRGRANGKATTPKEKKAVVAALKGAREVKSYVFWSRATAYRNFVRTYSDNEAFVSAVKVSDMPESYRVTMRPEVGWRSMTRKLASMPGVSQVYNQRCQLLKAKLRVEYGFLLELEDTRRLRDSKVCAAVR
ncbi:permease-like cell division protein FtsX [Nonomuraea sp. NPDC046802]|uniref:permease-like cell division protein FtsX n=1 Tax=Nonomuraea sp. NPDC046802 TaxID=3154919 RepID=UPI0033E4C895